MTGCQQLMLGRGEAKGVITAPYINGIPQVGVQSSYTSAVMRGNPTLTAQMWYVDSTYVSGVPTYTPVPSDSGKQLSVQQTWQYPSGAVITSSAPLVVQPTAAPTGTPNPILFTDSTAFQEYVNASVNTVTGYIRFKLDGSIETNLTPSGVANQTWWWSSNTENLTQVLHTLQPNIYAQVSGAPMYSTVAYGPDWIELQWSVDGDRNTEYYSEATIAVNLAWNGTYSATFQLNLENTVALQIHK